MTIVVWRGMVHRVHIHMFEVKRWGAWPEGYPDHLGMAWGPEQAIQEMGYRLDKYEQKAKR